LQPRYRNISILKSPPFFLFGISRRFWLQPRTRYTHTHTHKRPLGERRQGRVIYRPTGQTGLRLGLDNAWIPSFDPRQRTSLSVSPPRPSRLRCPTGSSLSYWRIQGAKIQIHISTSTYSLVRFQMVSLEFFIDVILSIALWPWCRHSL